MVTDPEPASDAYRFEVVGGALCLDFTNTAGRSLTVLNEHLETYDDLVRWGLQLELLDPGRAERLRERARAVPAEAERVLRRAIELRETIYRVFAAGVQSSAPEVADLERLNDALATALGRSRLSTSPGGFLWDFEASDELDCVLWPVLRSAADLLTSPERALVKECGSDRCEWLFLDSTKNKRRRWCDMRSCGNRAKVRRHRERLREEA